MAHLGGTIKASRKPGLKRPLVITENGWPVCRVQRQAGSWDVSSRVSPPTAPAPWVSPSVPIELCSFTNCWLLKQDFQFFLSSWDLTLTINYRYSASLKFVCFLLFWSRDGELNGEGIKKYK